MTFSVGALVRARGREWVVTGTEGDLVLVRPLGAGEDESTGIYTPLESVEHARFDLPDPSQVGDHRSCRLLREAVRISSRAGAGPFRSFSRIAIEPRPYQLVPLLMALRQPTVRLLIADDVGVGKTVEAALVARELLDRGEAKRLAVLCPPHLAEQWVEELRSKFHIDAELVLTSTAGRLERACAVGQSLFEVYPYVVVSLDFIKAERRRAEFLRACPDLVIVDEAHTCSYGFQGGGRHQRFELVSGLAADGARHLVLVTATPHTGNEDAFRSLLALLDPRFAELPPDLSGRENEALRRRLAAHIVQRRRADLRRYLAEETSFPDAEEAEDSYALTPPYKAFLQKVLAYIAETAEAPGLERRKQRVRWWSALALLRCVASSPAAAAATLRSRAPGVEATDAAAVDLIGARTVFDVESDDQIDGVDVAPGADPEPVAEQETGSPESRRIRERLLRLAREAEGLTGRRDAKLVRAVELLRSLVEQGYAPIVFCRFIPTAEYLADALRADLGDRAEVACVTGRLPSEEREARVEALKSAGRRVLVCTDCLSEGINLQDGFDAVFHYDLAWSPTRHEQRQGRVNRFGQRRPLVRAITYYGRDNGVDGIVLDALIRKHQRIRNRLGISVPVPLDSTAVFDAIVQGLVLRGREAAQQQVLSFMSGPVEAATERVDLEWERASERERRSRTLFAQETVKVDDVARELEASRRSIGSASDVGRFVRDAVAACGGIARDTEQGLEIDVRHAPTSLADLMGLAQPARVRFDLPTPEGVEYWARTHRAVQGLASYVLDGALDPQVGGPARRCGAIRTRAVERRTTILVLRLRFDLLRGRGAARESHLAEEVRLIAFRGAPDHPEWLAQEEAERLLDAEPTANIAPEQASTFVQRVIEAHTSLQPGIDAEGRSRAQVLLEAHTRVRAAAHARAVAWEVEPRLPGDVVGVFVLLPANGAA